MRTDDSTDIIGRDRQGEIPWPFSIFYDRYVNRYLVNWFRRIAEDIDAKVGSGAVLDVGTGPSRLPMEIAKRSPRLRVVGIDISKGMIDVANDNARKSGLADRVEFRIGSAYQTGFPDRSYDLVVSTGLVHHLVHPVEAFNEIHRVLMNGGEAWMYDGRKDATVEDLEETFSKLRMTERDLPLPPWVIKRIWPCAHVGYKTEVYTSGKIRRAIEGSPFRSHRVITEGAYVKIVLEKT